MLYPFLYVQEAWQRVSQNPLTKEMSDSAAGRSVTYLHGKLLHINKLFDEWNAAYDANEPPADYLQ